MKESERIYLHPTRRPFMFLNKRTILNNKNIIFIGFERIDFYVVNRTIEEQYPLLRSAFRLKVCWPFIRLCEELCT